MIRLLAKLAPPALMGFALWVYSDHFEGLDRSLEWREHTYEARSLAERIARDAGCPPHVERLADDLDAFSRTTADNPAQVALVVAMRDALARSDAARVAELADDAIEEENRLLPGRKATARDKVSGIRSLALKVCLLAIVVAAVQALVDFFCRVTEPRAHHPAHGVPPTGHRPGGAR